MNYKVICSKCKGDSEISIDEQSQRVTWRKIGTVISARFRLDNQWGFQCYCGNDSIMTAQEKKSIKDYAQPTPQELHEITSNLIIKPENSFKLKGI